MKHFSDRGKGLQVVDADRQVIRPLLQKAFLERLTEMGNSAG